MFYGVDLGNQTYVYLIVEKCGNLSNKDRPIECVLRLIYLIGRHLGDPNWKLWMRYTKCVI